MKQARRLKAALILESLLVLGMVGVLAIEHVQIWILVGILLIQVCLVLSIFFGFWRPFMQLVDSLQFLARTENSEDELQGMNDVMLMRDIYKLMVRYAAIKTRSNAAEIFNKHSALTALQSQISPHFLYNTLDSIRGQALLDDNEDIAKMIEALASFFRYSINRKGNLVTLREELANINNYMLIQRYRFNNRFSLEIIIDEEDENAYDFRIPRLIIQPIVENAIYHGLEEELKGGTVTIEIIVTEQTLILTISDDGKGISPEKLEQINRELRMGEMDRVYTEEKNDRNTGIALPNINKRIQLLFGKEYGVSVYSTLGQGTDVEITVPADYHEARE